MARHTSGCIAVAETPVRPEALELSPVVWFEGGQGFDPDYARSAGWHDEELNLWLQYLRAFGEGSVKLQVRYPYHRWGEIRSKKKPKPKPRPASPCPAQPRLARTPPPGRGASWRTGLGPPPWN